MPGLAGKPKVHATLPLTRCYPQTRAFLPLPQPEQKAQRRRLVAVLAKESPHGDSFVAFLLNAQKQIIQETEVLAEDGAKFAEDRWERDSSNPHAGYGITSVLEGNSLLEKAAVNISIVGGKLSAERAQAMSSRGRGIDSQGGQNYSAAAMSLVYHPSHPFIPTLRADIRRFKEDIREFHEFWKAICDKYGHEHYPRFKQWCDDYFYLPARKERRGVGGIFFDDILEGPDESFPNAEEDVANGWLASWKPTVQRRRRMKFEQSNRDWQLIRRGRYLEFNLLYDRGVKFGINGRIESVMVSAPPLIAWKYNVTPRSGSEEAKLLEVLRTPRSWA